MFLRAVHCTLVTAFTPWDPTDTASFVIASEDGNVFFDRLEAMGATVPEPSFFAAIAVIGAFWFALRQRRSMSPNAAEKDDHSNGSTPR